MTRTKHPEPTAVLAVDLGKTGCRAAVWTHDDTTVPVVRESPGAPGLATPGGLEAAEQVVLRTAAAALESSGARHLRAFAVGAAGAAAAPDAAGALLAHLLTGLPAADGVLTSDALTSHAGALGGGTGVVLAAGTGAVAIGVGPDGRFVQVDGWGPLLGDTGSGAWIGRAGLRAALRSFDGRGGATSLTVAAQQAFGADLGLLPAAVGQDAGAATTLASFAPAVAAAAADGDVQAAGILDEAADALAETVITAARNIRTIGQVPVAVTGGLLNIGPALLERLQLALGRSQVPLSVRESSGGSLEGGRLLAVSHRTALEPFLHRVAGRTAVTAR